MPTELKRHRIERFGTEEVPDPLELEILPEKNALEIEDERSDRTSTAITLQRPRADPP
jgi:hypothetical protein